MVSLQHDHSFTAEKYEYLVYLDRMDGKSTTLNVITTLTDYVWRLLLTNGHTKG